MAYTLFYILGNSDVQYNHQKLNDNYRAHTLELLKKVQEAKKNHTQLETFAIKLKTSTGDEILPKNKPSGHDIISFPILSALWQQLPNKPDRIVLLATDQAEEPFRKSDTIHAAELIEWFLSQLKFKSQITKEVMTFNPSDYDAATHYFDQFFQRYQKQLQNNLDNYFSLSAGTPALVHSFALLSLPYPFTYFYVKEATPPEVKQVKLYKIINRRKYAEQLKDLIRHFQYATALTLAKNSPFRANSQLINLLQAAIARMAFDWGNALDLIRLTDKKYHPVFKIISYIQDDKKEYYLVEMLAHLEIAYKIDIQLWLAWLFNLLENMRILMIEKAANIKMIKEGPKFPEWERFMQTCGLFNEEELKRTAPDRTNLQKALTRINKQIKENKWQVPLSANMKTALDRFVDFYNRLEKEKITIGDKEKSLQDLRNEGPFAHGTSGINEKLLQNFWPPYGIEGLMQELKTIINHLTDEPYGENPFKKINQFIEEHLQTSNG